jgi:UDP-2,3-diacylglucosamine hydrolase
MSHKTLHEGAILVADSHCAPWRTPFLDFLRVLETGKISTTQLILMGDNFDLLFGPISQTLELNKEAIDLLNRLSNTIEIIYLEGNHDFALESVFPTIFIVPLENQPLFMKCKGQRIALLHGDIHVPMGYKIYTSLIRNKIILQCLNYLNNKFGGFIIKRLVDSMQRKKHCKNIDSFETLAHRLIGQKWITSCDWVIEGHYHQNQSFEFDGYHYDNLGAFACNERYYGVEFVQEQIVLREMMFVKEPL